MRVYALPRAAARPDVRTLVPWHGLRLWQRAALRLSPSPLIHLLVRGLSQPALAHPSS